MAAFVIGNGISRREIDLGRLKVLGPVYGCNALYRDFAPDVLVATDLGISTEIQRSGYAQDHVFYTRHVLPGSGARMVPKIYRGFSSGQIAMVLAAMSDQDRVYLLGFDLGPDDVGKFNNVYAGTDFYKARNAPPTFTGNWIRQMIAIAEDFPQKSFLRVHGKNTHEIDQFEQRSGIGKLTIEQFLDRINNPKDL